ncbi:ThiF family adenylyltransferase [Nocardioides sp.]|uniref:ThiF family adenylyltransferase n=1 Tax=Nocardioides sp. TaxID=35761 RepID=UPI00271E5328|nr:ThiF family adenylyltransferase [Nocardioides sp.]MDO9455253.1 ThiF family adenylyltransferase [Nocardioides sp.]
MSTARLARNADLRRLIDDGYGISIEGGHLVVRKVPYVTTEATVAYGVLTYPITVSGDQVVFDTDHRIWLSGSPPHDQNGRPLTLANPEQRQVTPELTAQFMLSSKPAAGYVDHYDKVTAYVRILAHPAQAVDPSVSVTPGAAWQEVEDDLPFRYRDTATTRAGLGHLTDLFRGQRVAIVGLGGSGCYILDQVAKTPVDEVLLVDGDAFDNHNAFRAPGAASLEELQARPSKVGYFAETYGRMHTGIRTEHAYLNEENLAILEGSTFVFLAIDDAEVKASIGTYLAVRGVAFIDVGMGVEEIDGKLSGLLRTVYAPAGVTPEKALERVPKFKGQQDDYDRNIQVADLNALNGVLAVVRWKRHLGLYADGAEETFSTYSIYTNEISNETPTIGSVGHREQLDALPEAGAA